MTSKFRTAAVAIVAALAIGSLAVSSASAALPEFQKEGKALTESVKFSGETTGSFALQTTSGLTFVCSGPNSVKGETKGAKEVTKSSIKFTSCNEPVKGWKCTSSGAKEGEMVTKELSGRIGYLVKAEKKVGLYLEPTVLGGVFAECNIGTVHQKILGAVIGVVTPVNTATKAFEARWAIHAGEKGKQEWTKFEGEAGVSTLEWWTQAGTHENMAIEGKLPFTSEKTIEIKA